MTGHLRRMLIAVLAALSLLAVAAPGCDNHAGTPDSKLECPHGTHPNGKFCVAN